MEGLAWLAGVGPAPLEAWSAAMGWAERTAFSHAQRLITAGMAARCSRRWGTGSLIYATRMGVEASGVYAASLPGEPAPTTWAHCEACAWTAAWLTARGRHLVGSRALLLDDGWKGGLEWMERDGLRRRAHRPDLVTGLSAERVMPVEVELASKSKRRLRSILALHAKWIAARKCGAVIYVCGPGPLADRVRSEAAEVGLRESEKTLRVELLDTVRRQALDARRPAGAPEPKVAGREAA